MRKSRPRERRLPGRGTAATAATGALTLAGAGLALVAELRHRQALAQDPQRELLEATPVGEALTARSADGTELHVEVYGPDGAPTVVLVPGWTEEIAVFGLLTRGLLARGFRVVAHDLRGQGRSERRRGLDQRIERYAEDIDAVLDAGCAGTRDVLLVGHSMGAMAAVAWAGGLGAGGLGAGGLGAGGRDAVGPGAADAVGPGAADADGPGAADADGPGAADAGGPGRGRVRALALVSTGVSGIVAELEVLPRVVPAAARRAILAPLLSTSAPVVPVSTPLSRVINRHLMFGPRASAAQLALVEPMVWRMDGRLRAAAARTMRELDLSDTLARIELPTLVVVGEQDRLTPPVHARRLVAALPHVAEFLVLPQTGHMVQLERPEELSDAVARLARTVGATTPWAP